MTKIYTLYTETHKHMLEEYFLPSVPSSFEIVQREFPQECPTGAFHADGWMKTMTRKVEYIIESIQETMGSWFIHSDCDIQFFEDFHDDIESHLGNLDMVGMDDNMLCAGFFASKSSPKTLHFWNEILDKLEAFPNDQLAMNAALRHPTNVIHYKYLPRFEYFNYMHSVGRDAVWKPGLPIDLTQDQIDSMKVHHANYIVGVDHKVEMMEYIRNVKNQSIQTGS